MRKICCNSHMTYGLKKNSPSLALSVNNYNDNFDIAVSASYDATKYVNELINVFERHNIPVEYRGCRTVAPVKYTPMI